MSTLGRWLQPPPKGSLEQQYQELVNQLRTKERALETTSHDLKVKTAAMQILEQKIMSAETQVNSAQRELISRGEQIKTLETELALRSKRVADIEIDGIAAQQQVGELKSTIAAQTDELRAAQQAREVLKEEIRVLREHVAQLNEGLADRDQVRIRMEKLESAQDRVHLLEVELSDREAAHRRRIQQLEQLLMERDQRIGAFDVNAAAQADKLHSAQQACQTAEQARDVLKEEVRILREEITQLNEGLPARERLRAQVRELESMRDRVHQLEVELSDREATHRSLIQQLEQSITERDRRITEFDTLAAAHMDELHGAQQTCQAAEQTRDVLKEEIRVLREQIAQLNESLADRDRLRAQVKKLEATQDRVHRLEVELSDREATHRSLIQQLEQSITERDRRITEFDALAAAQANEVQDALEASRTAEQAREVQKEEIRVLREHIAQLNEGLAHRDRLRAQVKKLEATQDRVHQLEVELSDREAAHRGTIQQLEQTITERDRRITEFDALAAAHVDELHGAQQACQTAEQTREVLKEEIRVLREQITQLNESLADREQVRVRMDKLESAQDRVHQLEVELSDREAAHRSLIQQLEQTIAERDRRITEFDALAATQADEVQDAVETGRIAEQAREVQKEEIRVLREQIAQLNEGLAHRERLRARVQKLEATEDRVHQLEIELSDREAAHRGTIQQLEQALAERDHRIDQLVPITHLLHEKEATIKEWERTHARTVQDLEGETTKLQESCAAQDRLHAQHRHDEQQLQERETRIADLRRELKDLQGERQALRNQVESIPEKDEQIDRLQKRLRELRAALKATPPSSAVPPQPPRQKAAGPNSQQPKVGQPVAPPHQNGTGHKASAGQQPQAGKSVQADDLKKIGGIGPVLADQLQKLGTRTFIQIARWKPEDIAKIAKKLETDPERIKREHWIADAKKHHYRKYGERL
jgi:predicted flap endonuclease-1-like 5' DNA nuclease/chromosome segregation ATPase